MQTSLVNFIQVLRSHDVRISPAETLDAMDVADALGYSDRNQLRDGLAMTLAKTPHEEAVFMQCFDRYFSHKLADLSDSSRAEDAQPEAGETNADSQTADGESGEAAGDGESYEQDGSAGDNPLADAAGDSPELQQLLDSSLMQSLMNNDRNALSMAMSQAAAKVGLNQIEMFTQKGQFSRKILDELGEAHIRQAVIELERANSPALDELRRYRDMLREQVRDLVDREYLLHAEGRNQQFMDDILSKTRLNNIEHHYQQKVQALVQKMARKLAARYGRKRKTTRRGQLNMARTIRKGVATDGVLFNTYFRQVSRDKPQVLAVCDVSGSVAAYAKFLLMFLYAVQDVLPRVRSFAFSNHLGEVSGLFDEHPVERAVELVNWQYGGATDYGGSLEDFARLAMDDINTQTTVIILGDARNNRGEPRLDILQSIYQRAKQVIWLNPESRKAWGTGDSEMPRYQSACHFAAECNNLKQLERIIEQLLKSTR